MIHHTEGKACWGVIYIHASGNNELRTRDEGIKARNVFSYVAMHLQQDLVTWANLHSELDRFWRSQVFNMFS